MQTWDSHSIRERFASIAAGAENYANELLGRIKRNPKEAVTEKALHDEHRAKWFVYDSLSVNHCLEKRETLLAEARSRLEFGFEYSLGIFDKEKFKQYWRSYMTGIIKEYEQPTDP